jgi:hypothetical protein
MKCLTKSTIWLNYIHKNKNVYAISHFSRHKFFNVFVMIRNVHLILNEWDNYYLNNYANWNTYNIIYDENFLRNNNQKITRYKKKNNIKICIIHQIFEECSLNFHTHSWRSQQRKFDTFMRHYFFYKRFH